MSFSYLILLPFALIVATLVYNRWLHPLSKFPGPYLASFTDLFRLYHFWTGHMPETLVKLHEKYGPVVRYAPNELSFHTPSAIDPIYKNGRKTIKTDFYDGFTAFHPNVFGTRDEEHHAKRRRQMAHSFSFASLSPMESLFDRHISGLMKAIDSYGHKPFDLKELIGYYTYDLMGELVFNADFESLKALDPKQLPPINEHISLSCSYGMLPSLLPYSMRWAPYLPIPFLQRLLSGRRALRDRTTEHLANELAKDDTGKRQNILARLIQARDPETGEKLTEPEISSEAFGFLVAGSHTTSGSLTLLFYHLLHNPTVAERLTKELTASLELPNPEDASLAAYSGLEAKLPYATACIREAYRISPVFTMPLPRTIMEPGGAVIDGHHVPQGANVCIVNHVLHHNAAVWGDDHDVYRPERWLSSSRNLSPNDMMPFGAGHRSCIGRNIASISIVKVLTLLWRRYELEPVDPSEALVVESFGVGEKKGPLMVRAKPRT